MAIAAAERVSHSTSLAVPSVPLRRRALAAIASGGLLTAVGGGILIGTSDHLVHPTEYAVQLTLMLVGAVAAALYWLVRRPGNRLGWALLALAIATVVAMLEAASSPVLHSIGVLADPAYFLLGYYVVFAFPHGWLAGSWEKALLAAMAVYFLLAFYPWFFFSPVVEGGAPLAACNASCPSNGLMIADRPGIATFFGDEMSYAVIAIMLATLACLAYRLATATRPRRRALVPVYVPALALTVPVLVFHGVAVDLLTLDADTIWTVGWFLTVARIALPYAFLLAIVQATFFAAAALKSIVGQLAESPNASQLRSILADALDEPALEIAFKVDQGAFVDSGGEAIVPEPTAGRTATAVRKDGETVAVILHDDALDTDPELVDVAGQALVLALENDRLANELQLTNAELRATRARIVSAGEAERRKIERDLHDGAQQHLIALRIKVALAAELAEPEAAGRLAGVGDELEEILEELRSLAQGHYPPALRKRGLPEALAIVAGRSTPPARLEATSIGRYPEDVEAAVYFCCVESLQNVGKHAGIGAEAVVRLWENDGHLCFEIEDDGVGCDAEAARTAGTGYTNMTDRLAAVGGTLAIESSPGHGTTVRGRLRRTARASVD